MPRNGKKSAKRSRAVASKRTSSRRAATRLKRILQRHLPELREKYRGRSLGMFGSYVRGEQRKRSDLDVLVELGDDTMSLLKFIELEKSE